MKQYYLLRAFFLVLLSIFILLIMELQFVQANRSDFSNNPQLVGFLCGVFLIFILWILSIQSFYKFSSLINKEKLNQETDRLQLEESQKLIQALRAQRHDFRNQLQVIRVLAQFNKNAELDKYIVDCNQTLDFSYSFSSQIENPVIFAMLLVFATEAKTKGISFNVDSDLDFSRFNLSPAKLTRILGNIIQNAIEVLEKVITPDRSIQLTIWETEDAYHFLVWNNGPLIPEENRDRIFQSGFSTKNSTGLGLSIVKELVAEMNGLVQVKSAEESGTEFKFSFPKNISSSLPVGEKLAKNF